jgi:hypothetical protein
MADSELGNARRPPTAAELAQRDERTRRAQAELERLLEYGPSRYGRCPDCHDSGLVYAWFLTDGGWVESWGACVCQEPRTGGIEA